MAFLRVAVSLVALAGLAAASLEAQSTRAHVIVAPQGRARIASIAPPPPPPRSVHTYGETVFQNNPIIVTPDGEVLIDLGYGYEPVAQTCPYAYGYGCQSYGYPIAPQTPVPNNGYYAQPTYVPPRYAPPVYGAPVYAAPTYPSGGPYGYDPTSPQAGYAPASQPPTSNYRGCPPGYAPTGSYPPCIDSSRSADGSAAMPPASGVQSGHRTSAARTTAPSRVVRR